MTYPARNIFLFVLSLGMVCGLAQAAKNPKDAQIAVEYSNRLAAEKAQLIAANRASLSQKATLGMTAILKKAGIRSITQSKEDTAEQLRLFVAATGVRGLLVREFTAPKGDVCAATIYVFKEAGRNTEGKIKCLGKDGQQTLFLSEAKLD